MANFGKSSMSRLMTCERDIQTIFLAVVKVYDCSVIFGIRTPETQFELYKKGREEVNGEWVVKDSDKVVTFKDGFKKLSRHNYEPSRAADVVPYPIDWKDINKMFQLNGVVQAVQSQLLEQGKITKTLEWGGNWRSFKDYPHYQL